MQTLDPSMAGYWRRTKIRKPSRGEWEKDKLVPISLKTPEACQRCRIATNRSTFYWTGTET